MTYADYEPRSAWNARAPRGSTALSPSVVVGEALHWPGMAKPINAVGATGKARVASALRGWQNYHMDVRGWSDIAYQIAIDQVGRAWTLRGLNIRSGANGDATVNKLYGAFLLILGPGELPSAAMKATVKNVIRDFRARMPHASATPKGHKDVRAAGTDCPGPLAYAAIKRGEFTATATIPTGGTDVALTAAEIDAIATAVWNKVLGASTASDCMQKSRIAAEKWGDGGKLSLQLGRVEDDTDELQRTLIPKA